MGHPPNEGQGPWPGQPGQPGPQWGGPPPPPQQQPWPPGGQFPPGQFPPGQFPAGQVPPTSQFPTGQFPPGPPNQPPWGPPPGPPKPPWWRRFAIVGPIIAGVVVVALVATTVSLVVLSSDDESSDPSDVVTAYLEALSEGDAAKALTTIEKPGNERLLTADVVKRQQARAKISNIDIVDTTESGTGRAIVKATYDFGQRNADVDFRLTKSGSDWKIEKGAIEIDLSSGSLARNKPRLFGVDLSADTKAYVFPGPLEWGTGNKYIEATDENLDEWPLGPDSYYYPRLDFGISKEGNTAASRAVTSYLAYCALSTQTDASQDRPGCSQQTFAFDAIPGSVRWSDPRSMQLSSIKLSYSAYSDADAIRVAGSVPWQVTYRTRRDPGPVTRTASDFLSGSVDLTKDPPTFVPN